MLNFAIEKKGRNYDKNESIWMLKLQKSVAESIKSQDKFPTSYNVSILSHFKEVGILLSLFLLY